MVIRIVDEKKYREAGVLDVLWPSVDTISILYLENNTVHRMISTGKHKKDDFLESFGFQIVDAEE